jgi:CelD/BcsL family acetyltransferase involved in cellulose biosynthesis
MTTSKKRFDIQVNTRLLSGFDDPTISPEQWNELLCQGDTNEVFLTWQWQQAWWESFGSGQLLLISAERNGRFVALAPLFAEKGMVYFVGSGGSDYLDFIGDISDDAVLDTMLATASNYVPDFLGFVFYHIPDTSGTGKRLMGAAHRMHMDFFNEGDLPVPLISLDRQMAVKATEKKSLIRDENFLRRRGTLGVVHMHHSRDILPYLDEFFDQHKARWAQTPYPSQFCDQAQRDFYRRITRSASESGWLRFTRLEWQGRSIAFHFGFFYNKRFIYYKPSYSIDMARKSPGMVLLRQLLLAASAEGACEFDLGIGDEAYKQRFTTQVRHVRTWGLYPVKKG